MKQKKQKHMTNVELVANIMEYSRYGALAQMFVIDALTKVADAVAQSKPEDYGKSPLISGHAWIGVAKEIQEKLNENYGRRS